MFGFTGKILHINLTTGTFKTIPTEKYKRWGGGHGMGSALFWDLCEDKTITDGRDSKNVVCIATSPFSGTNVPSAGGRCEVVGVGVGLYPVSWFTRSNFGGRFSATMKYAGWDAIVISGKAAQPVWLDIRNDSVNIRSAKDIWGKDTKTTQESIWQTVEEETETIDGWQQLPTPKGSGYSTQKPAVLAIGPAGENQVATACLVHDAGNGAGQGGFGAVWGSKNLKAISFHGTGSVEIADPAALVQARFDAKEFYAGDVDNPDATHWGPFGKPAKPVLFCDEPSKKRRTQSCQGCINGCRGRYDVGYGNEVSCQETSWYSSFAQKWVKGDKQKASAIIMRSGELCNRLGINTYPLGEGLHWLEHLYHEGLLGPDKAISSSLDWEKIGSPEFAEQFLQAIATGNDIGKDLIDGWVQAACKWGREEDHKTGKLQFPYWGMPEHGYDPRAELEWGFETIMCDRDMNSHCFNWIFWQVNISILFGQRPFLAADKLADIVTSKLAPYVDSPAALDYSTPNMYSDDVMQLTRWHIHYSRFWKNSTLLCDFRWADLFNTHTPDSHGATGSEKAGEHVFWNAVTGDTMSLADGLEIGKQIWALDNAIWTLQGRHRDLVKFADYIYDQPFTKGELLPFFFWPCRDEKGEWHYQDVMRRSLDRDKFEDWKSRFYTLEGCDPETGWPTRTSLAAMDLAFVADELEKNQRIGKEG